MLNDNTHPWGPTRPTGRGSASQGNCLSGIRSPIPVELINNHRLREFSSEEKLRVKRRGDTNPQRMGHVV